MPFKVNGTTLTTQPSTHHWVERQQLGTGGAGHAIYPAVREYVLEWNLIDADSYNQLQGFYNAIGMTGTAVVSLPKYTTGTYAYFDYTGCVLYEPNFQGFFEEHYEGVKMLIIGIRT
jgi:hypothetical protein